MHILYKTPFSPSILVLMIRCVSYKILKYRIVNYKSKMSLNQEKLITIDANMSTIFGEVISRGGNCV